MSAPQIVDAACELIASGGLAAFSMPGVARRLGVGVTSLYWYFRSREDLLRAVAERVTAEFYEGLDDDAGLTGDDRVLRQFRVYWQRLQENPLWREVFISSFAEAVLGSPEGSRRAGAVVQRQVERMIDAGLDPVAAARAYRILSAFTRGSVLVMHREGSSGPGGAAQELPRALRSLTGDALRGWAAEADHDLLFDTGLRALWSGLRARSDTG